MLYKSLLLSAKAGQQYLAKGRARGATSKVGGGGGGGACADFNKRELL